MPENNNTTQNDIFGALSDWFSNYQPPDVYGGIDWAQLENNAATARARYTAYQNDLSIRKPYVDAGHQGLTALKDFTSGQVPLDQIPGFRAQMTEELGTLRNFQAARGRLLGGRAAGELMRTAGRITSDQWQREFSRRYKQAYSGSPFGYSPNYVGAPDSIGLDQFSKKYAGFGGSRTPPRQTSSAPVDAPAAKTYTLGDWSKKHGNFLGAGWDPNSIIADPNVGIGAIEEQFGIPVGSTPIPPPARPGVGAVGTSGVTDPNGVVTRSSSRRRRKSRRRLPALLRGIN